MSSSTPIRGLPIPGLGDLPDGPDAISDLALALDIIMIHGTAAGLAATPASSHARCLYYTTDTAGLFYSNGTTWKPILPTALSVVTAMIADLNVTTAKLADLSVTTGKLAALGVTEAKVADGAVTPRKVKALAGAAGGGGTQISLADGLWHDITNSTLTVDPDVASTLIVNYHAHFTLSLEGNPVAVARLLVDGVETGPRCQANSGVTGTGGTGNITASSSGTVAVAVDTNPHVLKLQAEWAGGGSAWVDPPYSGLSYVLQAT